jgi:Flp pilus assembly protein TadG
LSTDLQLRGRFLRLLGRFARSKGGNVALIFAVTLIPMLAATGMVVDYTRAAKAKQQLQDALDSTALFLSKNSSVSTMNSATLLQTAQNYFNVNFTNTDVNGTAISPSYSSSGPSVTVSGTTNSPCAFMSVLGIRSIPVSGTSTAIWGQKRLRVALVLDNTTSMNSSGKMTALKSATHTLLTQLQAAANLPEDVYVSIVPFVEDVKVDPSNYNASWMQFDSSSCATTPSGSNCDSWWDGFNGTCSVSGKSPRSTCAASGTCSITSKTSQSSCTSNSGCFVNGTYKSTYTSSSTCTAVGTCSLSGYTTQSTCTAGGSCSISSRTTQSSCTASGTCSISGDTTQSSCTNDGTCSRSQYTSKTSCTSNRGTWTAGKWTSQTVGTWTSGSWTQTGFWNNGTWTQATWTPKSHSTYWDGCITDRGSWTAPGTTAGDDQQIYSDTYSSAFPADQTSYCPQTMVGLTNSWTTLSGIVDGMSPNGYTNQPIGLVWGWQSLIGGAGLTVPAYQTPYQYQLVIILLSDGVNTQDRWYQSADPNTDSPQVDGRMLNGSGSNVAGTCANVKAAGITLYTVQVDTDGSGLSTLLQNCATDTSKFFRLTSSSQIITTFQTIGTALSQLRLSS